jgi:hypothetical protein
MTILKFQRLDEQQDPTPYLALERAVELMVGGNHAEARAKLVEAIDWCLEQEGEPPSCPEDTFYALQRGALWEFSQDGWRQLLERKADGRGYVLAQHGRCLAMNIERLHDIDAAEARERLRCMD